jgi:DNA-3-methyladenine glycosylase II
MQHAIAASQPFSFDQTLTFIGRFPPCRGHVQTEGGQLRAAITVGGRAVAFTMRDDAGLRVDIADDVPIATQREVVTRAAAYVGAHDDVEALYTAAEGDEPFRKLIGMLHGLHHVRFLSLAEIAVYSVMMQGAPITIAAVLNRRFLAAFGKPVQGLHAMPDLDELVELDAEQIAVAIRNRSKAQRIVDVIRGVRAIGEDFLRTAPYAEARDALLEIKGLGPFSATAILLRGLGRMDELPWMPAFSKLAAELYGERVQHAAIARRYGDLIGYWSFYLMTGMPRLAA